MSWIVFIYKVPSTPTKYRAYIWRELKKLGALYLQDGVCILPNKDDVYLFIDTLSDKVNTFGGQEFTFLSTTFFKEKEEQMIQQFNDARNAEYTELMRSLLEFQENFNEKEEWEFSEIQQKKIREEFQKLLRQFQIIEARDYFEADQGRKVRFLIDTCRKILTQTQL
ncbi:hypothetical protein LSG31_01260 [Fodinisporobacter ferrooxydans]|uniref:ChrB N-terminal domain-containing protein n=1 Tax=Fodinisporobacter ferrooxydans TaxID=2901836 RepID=A0ABY4CN33_9BACL|nr:hypothetical protein LSG31_01260 [Alicyclobacillaceae bacterium MYW30-H2]